MRSFILLIFCLIPALSTPLFAYTTHRTTLGPLSMHFGTPERLANQEKITKLDTPLELTATLINNGGTDLSVKVTFRTIETLAFTDATGNADAVREHTLSGTVVAKGTAQFVVNVIARPGTYTAHYPVRLDAEFELDGETVTAHIIQVIETELPGSATPKNPLRGQTLTDPKQLPLNTLPECGGLALATLDTYRGVWNYDGRPQQILPVGFQGSEPVSLASIAQHPMVRGGGSRQSIGMHPPWRGGVGNVGVEYRVQLPDTVPISLSFFSAMRDTHPPEPPSDGVTYRIKVDGKTVYEKHDAERTWVAHEVDLSEFAGQDILLTLESDPGPKRDTTCDQCFWGDVVLFAGEKPAILSAEEKQALFAENLQAIKVAAQRAGSISPPVATPNTHVFHLDGGLIGAVTFGKHGFIDGVIGLGNAEKQVQFDGLRVWVQGQLIGDAASAVGNGQWLPYSNLEHHGWFQVIEVGDRKGRLAFRMRKHKSALQFAINAEEDMITRIEFGPATHHAPRVYFGHGYCIVEPEAFTVHADGHTLSTSHVGMDFENGLSVLQATSTPIGSFIVDPEAKRYTLSVHPATTMTLLPGLDGALDCAIRFRPLHHAKPAPGVATKAGRLVFDIWGGRYKNHLETIKHAAKYGLTDSLFIVHNWQHYGYDNRLPDIYPPNPALGTLEEMQEALELCNSLGILYGVHDNYIDIYPDADGYNFDMTTFHANGQPRKAWNNYGIEAQAYQFRPDRIQPFLERNLDLLVPKLPMSAYFVDVFSSMSPMDYGDRDGNFHSRAETLRHWQKAFDTIRNRLSEANPVIPAKAGIQTEDVNPVSLDPRLRGGDGKEANKNFPSAVTISESGLDSLIGHLDGADSNFLFISPEPGEFRLEIRCQEWSRVPWYNAVHHTKFSLHGAGYSSRYEAQRGRDIHGIESDDYIVSEILTGHALMVDDGSARRGAVRKYWLAQDLIRHLADKEIVSVRFYEGNIHQQIITWCDGTTVYVNLDEKNDLPLRNPGGPHLLPQYGYLAVMADGKGYSSIFKQNGRVVEKSTTHLPDGTSRTYVNARQKTVDGLLPIMPTLNSFQHLGGNQFTASFKWDAKGPAAKDLSVFVHCVERRQTWHHRPNEAVLGGGFPATSTSEWSGEHVTDYHMAIPDTLPAGRYYLVVGLYDANGRGERARLIGFPTDGNRYVVGWINVERRDGAVSNITLEPFEWDETELYERLLPPKEPVQFWNCRTNGAFQMLFEGAGKPITVIPLPDEPATEIVMSFVSNIKTVKAVDDTGKVLRDVPFTYGLDGYPVFTTQSGEFAYKIVW